ncbi:MAG: hypothetical protein IKB07_08185 [Lachnospiraceae bacterium]|nr:hypothetical protein [Lachnospiraceae bacterium]
MANNNEENVTANVAEAATTEKKRSSSKKATTEKTVRIKLPKLKGQKAVQDEFYSYNFKNYIIKRGEYVEVPEGLAEIIENNEKAEDAAIDYIDKNGLREPQ